MRKNVRRRTDTADFLKADYAEVRLSDAEMIRLTGASRTTVAHWRTGKHPPPPAALQLARLAYFGEIGEIWPAFDGFRLGRDGRLYVPGFRYGFTAAELLTWHRLIIERDALEYRLRLAESDLARAETDLAISEAHRSAEKAIATQSAYKLTPPTMEVQP